MNPSKEQCSKFTDLSLQVALGRVPCSQTSLTGHPSGLGVMVSYKVYRPLFTGPPWQVPSQLISHYRPLLVRKMKNRIANESLIPKTLSGFVYQDLVVGWSGAWCASGCRKRQKPEMIRKAHIDRFRPKAAIKKNQSNYKLSDFNKTVQLICLQKPNKMTSYWILSKRSSLFT